MEEISVEIAKGQEEKIRKIEKGMELARKRIAETFKKNKKEYPIDSMIKRLMEKKEFAVGEEFQFGLKKLKVEKHSGKKPCKGCVFDFPNNPCLNIEDFTGFCSSANRSDNIDIIFVEVK